MTDAPNLAYRIGAFAAGLEASTIPGAVLERAKLHVLDSLGVALAVAPGQFADTMIDSALALGGRGNQRVFGRSERLSLRDAVQVNAALVHCLDYDDTHAASIVHVSSAALPVAMAVAADRGASGLDLLVAYLLSVETAAAIGAAAGGAFHARGFHPTGLVNAFGAAVAAGRLIGLDAGGIAAAQGVTLSLGAGSLEFLDTGAWTKRIHPGWGGVAGLTAASLVANGFQAPPRAYEGRFGLYALYAPVGTEINQDSFGALGRDWQMLKVGIKPLPACHFTHAFSDAAFEIAATHNLNPQQIADVVLRVPPGIVDVVCEPETRKRRPLNPYEAQFSLHYIVAATLLRRRFTLEDIEPEAISDPEVLRLADKVRYDVDPDTDYPRYFPGDVTVRMDDGRVFSAHHPHHRGSDARPLSAADVIAKFRANAVRALSSSQVERVIAAVDGLDQAPRLDHLLDAISVRQVEPRFGKGKS